MAGGGLRIDQLLDLRRLRAARCSAAPATCCSMLSDGLRVAGGLVLQHVGGMIGVAEQPRALGAQPHHAAR